MYAHVSRKVIEISKHIKYIKSLNGIVLIGCRCLLSPPLKSSSAKFHEKRGKYDRSPNKTYSFIYIMDEISLFHRYYRLEFLFSLN